MVKLKMYWNKKKNHSNNNQRLCLVIPKQDKSIDELLQSLGGFDDDYDDKSGSFWPSSSAKDDGSSDDDLDSKVQKLVGELQEWRQRNVDSPYEDWSTYEKDEFAVRVFIVMYFLCCRSIPTHLRLSTLRHFPAMA